MYFVNGRTFICTFEETKKKFYSSFNAIYSKIGRYASEEVVLNLLNTKCISATLYGTDDRSMMMMMMMMNECTLTWRKS